jgi:hypothetical protein
MIGKNNFFISFPTQLLDSLLELCDDISGDHRRESDGKSEIREGLNFNQIPWRKKKEMLIFLLLSEWQLLCASDIY